MTKVPYDLEFELRIETEGVTQIRYGVYRKGLKEGELVLGYPYSEEEMKKKNIILW